MWLIAVLAVLCLKTRAAKDFVEVSVCPPGPSEWQIQEQAKKCQDPTPDYLCAAVEHKLGHYGEICTKLGLSPSGTCAVLNNITYNLDSVPCKAPAGCPDTAYSPRDLYKWPVCYNNFYGIDRTTTTKGTPVFENATSEIITVPRSSAEVGDSGIVVGIVTVTVLIIIAAVVAVYILHKRNNSKLLEGIRACFTGLRNRPLRGNNENGNREDAGTDRNEQVTCLLQVQDDVYLEPSPRRHQNRIKQHSENTNIDEKHGLWNWNILKQYLVVSLKHYCGIEELKDSKVLYNTSLVHHFNNALLKPLFELSSWDDYQKLDTCLVYNLLRNVCKHVKPPCKGWGYEPAGEDVSLGADIERIRLLWNRYCDDKEDFEHLNDIFIRMEERFGDIRGNIGCFNKTDCNQLREKIQSVEFKPDCYVEDKIVQTKGIKEALETLEKENFVIVKGIIGCGKSTCLKYMAEYYRGKQWEVKWKEEVLNTGDFYVQENKKILLCCDNLFGAYNRGHFAGTSDITDALENHEKEGDGELKIVLAIHDHVYDELEEIQTVKALRNKSVIVDLNKMTAAESLLIFKEQRNRGHCTKDRKCWFRTIDFESIQTTLNSNINQGLIGDPLLMLLYSNQHDIFTRTKDKRNLMEVLCSLFQRLLEETPELFCVLVYVMCVKTYKLSSTVPDWASSLGDLNSDMMQQQVCKLDSFLEGHVDGKTMRMKHDFLSIALFKVCSKYPHFFTFVLDHCHFEMIEELLRPASTINGDFFVSLEEDNFETLISRLEKEHLFMNFIINHPLMKNSKFRSNLENKCPPSLLKMISLQTQS